MRAEPGNFDVVPKQIRIFRNFVDRAAEKLFLVIEARAPCEIRAYFQIFAFAMADHVFGVNALRVASIMRAAGGVNMMIARPPAQFRSISPALNLEIPVRSLVSDFQLLSFPDRFRPAGEFYQIIT